MELLAINFSNDSISYSFSIYSMDICVLLLVSLHLASSLNKR